MSYEPIPYPRMLYRFPEGTHTIVESEAEEAKARQDGYVDYSEREAAEAPKPKAKKTAEKEAEDTPDLTPDEPEPLTGGAPPPEVANTKPARGGRRKRA